MSATPRPWGKANFIPPQGWQLVNAKNWPIGYFANVNDRDLALSAVNVLHALGFEDAETMVAAVKALVDSADAILADADATVPFERQEAWVQRLRAALDAFKEMKDA